MARTKRTFPRGSVGGDTLTRRRVLAFLERCDRPVSTWTVGDYLRLETHVALKHLRVLRKCGLVERANHWTEAPALWRVRP